jgi:hypothetical protein
VTCLWPLDDLWRISCGESDGKLFGDLVLYVCLRWCYGHQSRNELVRYAFFSHSNGDEGSGDERYPGVLDSRRR